MNSSFPHPPMPFIVGVGRSGTTLLRMMLDAHEQMCIPPETAFIPAVLRAGFAFRDARRRERFFQIVTQYTTWPDMHLQKETLLESLQRIQPFDVAEGIRAFYQLYARRFEKSRWGDKTPIYGLHMHRIQRALPEARFIHLIRDGRDVALSVRGLWFAPGKTVAANAKFWRKFIHRTRALAAQCRYYLEIRYEDLIAQPERELRKACSFIDLPYSKRMLRYFEYSPARLDEVETVYKHNGHVLITKEERQYNQRLTTRPPDLSRLFRWKEEMSPASRKEFERVAGDLLDSLGYETGADGTRSLRSSRC